MPQPAVGRPRVYADGSALSRYLPGAPHRAPWLTWARSNGPRLLTTQLGVSELRGTARMHDAEAREIAQRVLLEVEVVRISDQAVNRATDVAGVLPPFVAMHLGAARAHPDVTAVATYDARLARVAVLYGLEIVTPGRAERWWEADATPWLA
ncbi:PIN domain-containing protein [Cellulomonas persica]|uniref:PIN domain-containing protein n=1 Tax=Cellulomonas persica TaxID=76861 RepID=UPI001C990326|nr:PIN domain-containing protein [Cellulomonas persica]